MNYQKGVRDGLKMAAKIVDGYKVIQHGNHILTESERETENENLIEIEKDILKKADGPTKTHKAPA